MTRVNDIGGMHGFGPLEFDMEHREPYDSVWEGQLMMLIFAMVDAGHLTLDQFRHAVESLPPAQYFGLPYYERALVATEQLFARKGLL